MYSGSLSAEPSAGMTLYREPNIGLVPAPIEYWMDEGRNWQECAGDRSVIRLHAHDERAAPGLEGAALEAGKRVAVATIAEGA